MPVAGLDATERRAITIGVLGDFLWKAAPILNRDTPKYFTRYEALHFMGKRYLNPGDNKIKIALNVGYLDSKQDGVFSTVVGFSNVSDVE